MRWRIVEAFAVHGPGSVRELATRTGRKSESLYYHVRALLDVGLLVHESTRSTGRRCEAVYRLVALRLLADRKQRSSAFKEALCRSCEAFLRLTARDHRAAVDRGDFVFEGPSRNLAVRRHTASLSREGLRKLNRLLDRIAEVLDGHDDATTGDAYVVTLVLTRLGNE